MDNFTNKDLEESLLTITSMISRSEKVKPKLKEGSPQASLTNNRLKALYIASSLIEKKLGKNINEFTSVDLEKSLPPITSTINKCEKANKTLRENTSQSTLTKAMLKALYISLTLITHELNKQ